MDREEDDDCLHCKLRDVAMAHAKSMTPPVNLPEIASFFAEALADVIAVAPLNQQRRITDYAVEELHRFLRAKTEPLKIRKHS
jgi:hypothetical protein